MHIISRISSMRSAVKQAKRHNLRIGFVPTMGALHAGHLSLIRRCRNDCDLCVISIFVNPFQFGPHEDFKNYPRTKKNDIFLAKKENVDIIFYPSEKIIYPTRYLTTIAVEQLSDTLCGKSRPGHFRGVTTVVGKLLNIIQPDVLYCGQKDAQQCIIIEKMLRDLNFDTKLKILPTVRENDGLACSSRNEYLTFDQRKEAVLLHQSLKGAKDLIRSGEKSAKKIKGYIKKYIEQSRNGEIDYIACVDFRSLQPQTRLKGRIMVALAVKFGQTRLIDNIFIRVP